MDPSFQALTPSEAQVLLDPGSVSARSVLRTSLMHLAAAGHLHARVQEKRSRFGSGVETRLVRGASPAAAPAQLAVVLDALFPPGKPNAGLAPAEATHRLQRAFGYDYSRYLARHIRPLLVSRGLLEVESYRWLGIFTRSRHRHTAAGARIRERIAADLRATDDIPRLLERDPARAAASAAKLGGLVLVAEGLRPHLGALAAAARRELPDTPGAIPLLAGEEEDDRRTAWLDAAELASSLDWGALMEAIDGVGEAFDGGDGGGGDGGGDGGGGE